MYSAVAVPVREKQLQNCRPRPRQPKVRNRQTCPVSVEDTVRRQLGGKLFFSEFSNFNPADSITVIETHYRKAEGKELYREYRFITHNRNSPAHMIAVFSSDSSSPRSRMKAAISGLTSFSSNSRELPEQMKSSAYLT